MMTDDGEESEVMSVDSSVSAEEGPEDISFPIVLTTYEMIIKDRATVHLARIITGPI
jgi:hypothetical protein